MIAKQLKRSCSTISRELQRNRSASGYLPDTANRIAWARKLRGSSLERSSQLKDLVKAQLGMGWTPEQISGRLQLTQSDHRISAESIYRFIYSAAGRRLGWHRYLTQKKAKRGYRAKKRREQAKNSDKLLIWLRPAKAHLRSEIEHWDGDCMLFRKQNDILLTLQERRTRVWLMQKLPRRDAETTANSIIDQLENLPPKTRTAISVIREQLSNG
ncbi:IS30 family transposase [Cohaesibacter sp. ES.047]|uniref:IS30 family transposase n=1 Tax=Cohaesibacter sp. ES.047 TaxID=1798205 RepID=UPI0012FE5C0D|nr:IS30 family transposase [Cohaesibacter sp. ES.047]